MLQQFDDDDDDDDEQQQQKEFSFCCTKIQSFFRP
jgi:hypothetical protein